jgi:predicted RNA-binding Zn-ribbon protein involved in translation (DUF1610 family)
MPERDKTFLLDDLERLMNEDGGYCLSCGAEVPDGLEPDARGYDCEECGEPKVYAAEEIIQMGLFYEDDAPMPYGVEWDTNPDPPERPQTSHELVKASCGHTVRRKELMHASLGTSCPDCYDRLSD